MKQRTRNTIITPLALIVFVVAILSLVWPRQRPEIPPPVQSQPMVTETQQAVAAPEQPSGVIIPSASAYKEKQESLVPLNQASVEERVGFTETLNKKSSRQLFDQWTTLIVSGSDPFRAQFVADALSLKLRSGSNESTYGKIGEYLVNASVPIEQRQLLLGILGSSGTENSLEILLKLSDLQGIETEIKSTAITTVREIGGVRWDEGYREELSPLLENAWRSNTDNPELRIAIAHALAKVGTPSGVTLLVSYISQHAQTVEEVSNFQNRLLWEMGRALGEITNPNSVPALQNGLRTQDATNVELWTSGTALAHMGRPEAANALLLWASQADGRVAPLVGPWISEALNDPKSFQLVEKSLTNGLPFVSQDNKNAIKAALREWRSNRSER